jgi:hypothetical protein
MKQQSATLARHAQTVGETWAQETVKTIHAERRVAAGGFPGTMTEARTRVAILVLPWLTERGGPPATPVEREAIAKAVYQSAKQAWWNMREPEAD